MLGSITFIKNSQHFVQIEYRGQTIGYIVKQGNGQWKVEGNIHKMIPGIKKLSGSLRNAKSYILRAVEESNQKGKSAS